MAYIGGFFSVRLHPSTTMETSSSWVLGCTTHGRCWDGRWRRGTAAAAMGQMVLIDDF
jgi:hypothetical protein